MGVTVRRYGALEAVVVLIRIGAILVGLFGVAGTSLAPGEHPIESVGIIIATAISVLLLWAASELLMVMAGLGEDVSALRAQMAPEPEEIEALEKAEGNPAENAEDNPTGTCVICGMPARNRYCANCGAVVAARARVGK